MNIFNLPDLGEGLPDAEIHEWFVKEGDHVKTDQPLVSMETAKAVVDVPSPQEGVIVKFYGQPGDVIKTGEPLVAFAVEEKSKDQGTVVGNLEESADVGEDNFIIGTSSTSRQRVRTTPAVRILAKKLGIDLNTVKGTGEHGIITREDIQNAAQQKAKLPDGFEPLKGVRRAMLNSMVQSHQDVVSVNIYDEADIDCWTPSNDITVRLIHAIVYASKQEPSLNAWFNTEHAARRCFQDIHLGLAMDTDDGLFVPVIHNAQTYSAKDLRAIINDYKHAVTNRAVDSDSLKGATITLSNFGKFAGRFASPIIVPPTVAILAVGRLYQGVVSDSGQASIHKLLPLSLSFDHRAVTGGEATRFLGAVIDSLGKPEI